MLLQRLATGTTGVKQARYRRGPTQGSESLYAHVQYSIQSLVYLLFNAWSNACIRIPPRVLHFSAFIVLCVYLSVRLLPL